MTQLLNDREFRQELFRDMGRARLDVIAHEAEHKGAWSHTIGGGGPGSECCRYHSERLERAIAAYAAFRIEDGS